MDKHRRIRLQNTTLASFGGLALSLVLIYAQIHAQTLLSNLQMTLSLLLFWLVNTTILCLIISGYSRRLKDGSMSEIQM